MSFEEVIKNWGNIDEKEIKKIKDNLEKVREKLVKDLDKLKNKNYKEGWDKIFNELSVNYIEKKGFSNISTSLNNENNRNELIKYIQKILKAEKSNQPQQAYNAFNEILKKEIDGAGITVVSTLGHILKPEWFIPLTHSLSWAVKKLGFTEEHLAGSRNYEEAVNVFKKILKNENTIEDCIKISYALYEYGKKIKEEGKIKKDKSGHLSKFHTINQILEQKGQVILYGVPGTGKTWLAKKYVEKKKEESKENKCNFTTFHQSYSYEDFIEGFRPKTKETGNGKKEIVYEVEDGIFKKMCIRAIYEVLKNKENDENKVVGNVNFETVIEKFKEKYSSGYELKTVTGKGFKIKSSNNNIIVTTSEGGEFTISYNLLKRAWEERNNINNPKDLVKCKIDTTTEPYSFIILQKMKEIEQKLIKDDNNSYEKIKKEVIQKLKEHEKSKNIFKPGNFDKVSKYYLIIDEINRGNISNILGELITLLEMDKRLTGKNELIVTLPYSREPFAVPPNLYIIGTMNTADRSIALLDVALRRRFGFIEIEPEEGLLTKDKLLENWRKICKDNNEYQEVEKELNKLFENLRSPEFLKNLLETINKKIVKLKGKDYRIGHSYFLKVKSIEDLKFVWFYEVIPLLEEYFYEDWESLKDILKNFVKEEKVDDKSIYIYKIKKYEDFDFKDKEGKEFIKALERIIKEDKNNQSQVNQNVENQNE